MSATSAGGLIVMCAVIVVGLLIWIGLVLYVVRHPHWRRPKINIYDKPGKVRGGVHVGDPGSMAPRRDAPVHPPPEDELRDPQAGRPPRGS